MRLKGLDSPSGATFSRWAVDTDRIRAIPPVSEPIRRWSKAESNPFLSGQLSSVPVFQQSITTVEFCFTGPLGTRYYSVMFRKMWLLAVVLGLCADLTAEPRLWGHLRSGRHSVGFRTLRIKTTPVKLQVWYPALSNQGPKVTLGDYMRLSQDLKGSEPDFGRDRAALRKTLRVAVMGRDGPPDDKRSDEILAMPFAATRNATVASGKFSIDFLDPPLCHHSSTERAERIPG
jgi:hypothetical protein